MKFTTTTKIKNKERKHRTNVYLLIVDKEFDDWDEKRLNGRSRKWFNIGEARLELEKNKPIQATYLNLLKGNQQCELKIEAAEFLQLNSSTNASSSSSSASTTATSNANLILNHSSSKPQTSVL